MTSFDDTGSALALIGPGLTGTALDEIADVTAADRLAAWLRTLGENTSRAYARDLQMLADHIRANSISHALEALCSVRRSRALLMLEAWRDAQVAAGIASATINRRLSAVNSALREIAKADIGPGRLEIKLVRQEARRDTRGPDMASVAVAARALARGDDAGSLRDLSLLLLASQRGLRRNEIATLRVQDVDLPASSIRILRKGRRERQAVKLAPETAKALERWLAVRPQIALPHVDQAFVALGNAHRGEALGGAGVWGIVKRIGVDIGEGGSAWRPHGLRHAAITSALKASNGNLAAAKSYAGHSQVTTTDRYVDNVAELIDGILAGMPRLLG